MKRCMSFQLMKLKKVEVKQNLIKDGPDEAGLQKRVMETMLEKRDLHAEQ